MRKRTTRDEALAEIQTLDEEERAELKLVQEKRPTVLKRKGKTSRAGMQQAANIAMDKVVRYLRLLEALDEDTDTATPPNSGVKPELHPRVSKVAADARAIGDSIEDAVAAAVNDEQERTRRGCEAQIAAATVENGELSELAEDFQLTTERLATELRNFRGRQKLLDADLAQVTAQRDEARAQVAILTAAKDIGEHQMTALQTEIKDVRVTNGLLVQELTEVKEERDGCRRHSDEKSELATKVTIELAIMKEQRDSRSAEAMQVRSVLQHDRERHVRELALVKEDYSRQLTDARKRISDLEPLVFSRSA
jgi:chromosome segregation ATPase